jgi:hypothetical protein
MILYCQVCKISQVNCSYCPKCGGTLSALPRCICGEELFSYMLYCPVCGRSRSEGIKLRQEKIAAEKAAAAEKEKMRQQKIAARKEKIKKFFNPLLRIIS